MNPSGPCRILLLLIEGLVERDQFDWTASHMRKGLLYRETQERLALHYFSADYEDALAEVDMILAADPDATPELQLFRHKLLLWKALESTLD